MASYFNYQNPAHLALLPPPVQSDPWLQNAAAVVEADIIAAYTEVNTGILRRSDFSMGSVITQALMIGQYYYVCLRGYQTDSLNPLVDPNFATAMVNTVAACIPHRIYNWRRNPMIKMEMGGSGAPTKTYSETADRPFPPQWNRYLKPFDLRLPSYTI